MAMPHFGARSTAEQVLRDFDLSGKYVLITGSNCGIGFESARALAKHKAIVYAGYYWLIDKFLCLSLFCKKCTFMQKKQISRLFKLKNWNNT